MSQIDSRRGRASDRQSFQAAAGNLARGDAELMLRVRDGDALSFGLLLEKYWEPVLHFLCAMVRNRAVAEELTQEVFLRVYRSRAKYEPKAKFTTWLFRIATHQGLNSLRDGRDASAPDRIGLQGLVDRTTQLPDRTRTAEQELVYQVNLSAVKQAIESLPAKQRAAVMMHKYEELDYLQIAKLLACSKSAVKSLIVRAYRTLRTRLTELA